MNEVKTERNGSTAAIQFILASGKGQQRLELGGDLKNE
jgi:hypothetical protein